MGRFGQKRALSAAEKVIVMFKKSLLTMAMMLLAAGSGALAQTQNCPRPDCPNQGQNCPRQGQCPRGSGNAALKGRAANRGYGRGAGMGVRCGRPMNAASTPANPRPENAK
jgi:hypothetical protein